MELGKKLAELRPHMLNCNAFSIYDYPESYTITELLCEFFKAINGCIELCNKVFDLAEWLVNEGLEIEVAKKLDLWLQDGTLQEIINEKIFKELSEKVDTNKLNIERIESEYKKADSDLKTEFKSYIHAHVNMFGADPTGVKECTTEIQQCIDYVASKGGGIVQFGKGIYLLDKPLYLPSYVTLQGEGMQGATTIERRASGLSKLIPEEDYKIISRDEFLRYDACIIVEPEGVYWGIKKMELRTKGNPFSSFGVLAPWCALFNIEELQTSRFGEHFRIFNAWNTNWSSVRMMHGSYGIRLEDIKPNIDTACTSWVMDRVFTEYVDYGYKFIGLQYSSLNAICADQINLRAYGFYYCYGISINGMGCENSTGQIIKNKFSQLSIQGGFFLAMKGGAFPSDAISNSLVEIDTTGRAWCGIHMTESLFKSNNSGKKLLFISRDGNFSGIDIRVNDGTQLGDMEEGSVGGFSEDNVWNLELKNKVIKVKDIKVDTLESNYAKGVYRHYPGVTMFVDVGNEGTTTTLEISKKELLKNFSWVTTTDNYMWYPLKISVMTASNGSCNYIWYAHNVIKKDSKIVLGTDIVSDVLTTTDNLRILFTQPQNRLKVAISLA